MFSAASRSSVNICALPILEGEVIIKCLHIRNVHPENIQILRRGYGLGASRTSDLLTDLPIEICGFADLVRGGYAKCQRRIVGVHAQTKINFQGYQLGCVVHGSVIWNQSTNIRSVNNEEVYERVDAPLSMISSMNFACPYPESIP